MNYVYGEAEMASPSGKGITKGMAGMTAGRCWGCISLSPLASDLDSCPERELIAASGGSVLWGAWAGQGPSMQGSLQRSSVLANNPAEING